MRSRRLLALPFAAALILSASACNDDESVFNADTGECVPELPEAGNNIENIEEIDCEEPHIAELVVVEHEGDGDFPGQEEISTEAAELCTGDAFEDYVGVPYADTQLDLVGPPVTPSEESWEEGDDRESICFVGLPGEEVEGSLRGQGDEYPIGGDSTDGEDDGSESTTTTLAAEEDADVDALVDDCEGGDMAACDELYQVTDVGSPEEEIGATCGGRSEEPVPFQCEELFG